MVESECFPWLVLWVVFLPLRFQGDVVVGSLMAEEQVIVSVIAGNRFRGGDKCADAVFYATKLSWSVKTVDCPEGGACGNLGKILDDVFGVRRWLLKFR